MLVKVVAHGLNDQLVLPLLISIETACKIFIAGHFHFLLNKT